MRVVKLSEIAEISAGQGAPQGDENYGNEGVPFVKAGNLIELLSGVSEHSIQHVSDEVAKKHRLKLYPSGSILFAKSGMSCMKGHVYKTEQNCCVVSHLAVVTPKKCDGDFLKHYFQYFRPNTLIKDEAYPSISLQDIGNIDINIPALDEQQRIARMLDKVCNLISLRKQQLSKLDELVKARFVEMFGIPGTDEFGWGLSSLGKCCELNPKKAKDNRLTSGLELSFVPMPAVSENGAIDPSDTRTYDEVKTGFTYFSENDVLFAKITPCMENGKGAVAVGLTNGIGFGSTEFHIMRPIQGVSNPYWLYVLSVFKTFRKEAEENMTGSAGQRRVPASFLDNYKVALPPYELQEQFADFVKQTDKLKFEIQKSLEKLETFKKALMQKYFG